MLSFPSFGIYNPEQCLTLCWYVLVAQGNRIHPGIFLIHHPLAPPWALLENPEKISSELKLRAELRAVAAFLSIFSPSMENILSKTIFVSLTTQNRRRRMQRKHFWYLWRWFQFASLTNLQLSYPFIFIFLHFVCKCARSALSIL